jgi:LPXTG-motif cell wall-anchored protein
VGDSDVEDDETFTVVLSDEAGASLADDEGLGTIIDDDAVEVPTDDSPDEDAEVEAGSVERTALPLTGNAAVPAVIAGAALLLAGIVIHLLRRRLA